jgi:predicted AlkP superfamily phosphohydrolase/phosphomutase
MMSARCRRPSRLFAVLSLCLIFAVVLSGCTISPPISTPTATQPAATPTVALSTATVVPPTAALTGSTPIPTLVRKGPGVILLSVDGAPANVIAGFIADGTMPTLARLAQGGAHARYALSINPTLTAAAQSSISTGSLPRHTGIVSNRFHLAKDDFYYYQDGFSMPLADAEPVWKTAQKAGLRTAAIFAVGGQTDLAKQLADYTVGYGKRDIYSNQIEVSFVPAETWARAPMSFSPARQGKVPIVSRGSTIATLLLLATDTSDNGKADYDTFYLCEKAAVSSDCATLTTRAWGSFVINKRIVSGADFKITDPDLGRFKLFQSAVNYNAIAPVELLRAINARFGFFPPSPDYYALEHGWITAEDYLDMVRRQSGYQMDVAKWVWETYAPDLMFTYQAPIDESMHQFLLVDPNQPGYTPEKAKLYEGYRRAAAKIVDNNLARLLQSVDLKNTTLLMVSDHGMAPIRGEVNVNTILEGAGLLKLYEGKTDVETPKSQAIAFTSGAAGHIYINVKGREAAGIVPETEVPGLTEKIIALLKAATDPKTGQPIFSRVVDRAGLAELGLDTPMSGDVFVQAAPGFALADARGIKDVFAGVQYFGQHGQDPTLDPLHAIFYAAGRGIKPGVVEPVKLIDVAPTIAKLLGFQPAASVDGQVITAVLQ